MSNAARAQQEPTMEEILASIRRIISDDTQPGEAKAKDKPAEAPAAAAPKPVESAPTAAEPSAEEELGLGQDDIDAVFASMEGSAEPAKVEEPDDVLELTSDMSEWDEALAEADAVSDDKPAEEPVPAMIEPAAVVFDKVEAVEPAPAPQPKRETPQAAPQVRQESRSTQSQVLAEALLSPATDAVVSSAFGSLSRTLLNQNPRTVEDLVSDMLRPMLKDWLDANLPQLVERMVRSEIERMSRGHH